MFIIFYFVLFISTKGRYAYAFTPKSLSSASYHAIIPAFNTRASSQRLGIVALVVLWCVRSAHWAINIDILSLSFLYSSVTFRGRLFVLLLDLNGA